MATRVTTQLISDLSGKDIPDGEGETIDFSIRGISYAIDLAAKEVDAFDRAIAKYINSATKVGRTQRSSTTTRKSSKSDARQIRAWAAASGIDVPSRGRIPDEVRAQFQAAQ